MRPILTAGLCLAAGLSGLYTPQLRADDSALPHNMGRQLRQMVAWYQEEGAAQAAGDDRRRVLAKSLPDQSHRAQIDATGSRVVVNIQLNGTQPYADVRASLEKLGIEVFAGHDIGGAGSTLSARLPFDRAVEASQLPGVQSIKLVRRPQRHVGKVTSQGAGVIKSNLVNAAGYTGRGITVGVISDSFDLVSPHASDDVATDDLPGPGNPAGRTTPVNVVAEGADDEGNTDEGRAMLQIVHDIAPDANLAFATVGDTPDSFAEHIRELRTRANCDVIVDDELFYDEPMFSDGVISQAIDDVVNSTSMAGKKVLYYTAAGNSSNGVYLGDFDPVNDASVRAGLGNNNLRLEDVPGYLTAGGFHNYNPKKNKTPIIVQHLTVRGSGMPVSDGSDIVELEFQWDDPYVAGKITSDYNLLIFDEDGNYLASVSGTDNNFQTGEPSEYADLHQADDGGDRTYQVVITRTNEGPGTAVHLRTVAQSELSLYQTDNFTFPSTPSIYGHQAPPGGDAVAAYDYQLLTEPETYSSVGPMTVYFDRAGNRLAAPEVRNQPTIAAPDGVDTTFFPSGSDQDSDGDGYPNFYGTSAAAPHAAGAAALLLQAGGGPASLSAATVRSLLQATTFAHDLDPALATARVLSSSGRSTVTITANGNDSDNSVYSPKFFQVNFTGAAGSELRRLTIDLTGAALEFDPDADTGYPFTISRRGTTIDRSAVAARFSGPSGHPTSLRLKFPAGVFLPGDILSFGVDRDDASIHAGGNSADALAGAAVVTRAAEGGIIKRGHGGFVNKVGAGNSIVDGYGLINVDAAFLKLLGQ